MSIISILTISYRQKYQKSYKMEKKTDIVNKWGFRYMGRFAAEYQKLFMIFILMGNVTDLLLGLLKIEKILNEL